MDNAVLIIDLLQPALRAHMPVLLFIALQTVKLSLPSGFAGLIAGTRVVDRG